MSNTRQRSRLSIDPWIVLVSFGIGMFIVYMTQNSPQVIIKLPTPKGADAHSVFRDDVDNCYTFKIDEVPCSGDAINFPIERHLELFQYSMV